MKNNVLIRVFFIFIFLTVLVSCNSMNRNLRSSGRTFVKIENYENNCSSKNAIIIKPIIHCKNKFCDQLEVLIKHGAKMSPLGNLIFTFYTEDEMFYGISPTFNFYPKQFDSVKDTTINFKIDFDSLQFSSPILESKVFALYFKTKLNASKKLRINATINDWSMLNIPYSSTSLRYSNSIKIEFEK